MSNTKKVVIDCRMLNNSGVGTYIKNIIPAVLRYFQDYTMILLVHQKSTANNLFQVYNNVKIIKIKSSIYSLREQFEILFKLPKKIDLYWSPHYVFPVFLNAKILLTVHDIYHLKYSNHLIKNYYSKFIYLFIRLKVDKIITVSDFTKKELINYANVKANNIVTIHNGINTKINNLNNKKIILTVGNLKKHKNIKMLINAFENIQNNIDYDLYIIGNYNSIRNVDQESLFSIKQNNRIHLIGEISQIELNEYYKKAILYIHPSLYEGFGFPPLEAMTFCCPTLVSNNASIPEVCGNASEYFNPNDVDQLSKKILNILSDNNMRDDMVKRGINRVKKFGILSTINKTIKVIEEYIN